MPTIVGMGYPPKSSRPRPDARPDMLTFIEVATALDVSVETIRRWHRAGKIHGHLLGAKTIRFPRTELDRLLSETRV